MLKVFLIFSLTFGIAWSNSLLRPWSQCGGFGWPGPYTCPEGFYCAVQDEWYSQCLPGDGGGPTTSTASTTRTTGGGGGGGNSHQNCLTFTKGSFQVGISYDRRNEVNVNEYDYVTIWMNTIDAQGSTAWNQWYQGDMLTLCKLYRKTPLFYAYVIAFEARAMIGIQDCDVDPVNNLCHQGSQFIRNNRQHILDKYKEHAYNIALTYGTTDPVIFEIEPDFWQYYGDSTQQGGPLSGDYMRALFDDIVSTIKAHLPKAMISWDISAWIGQSGFRQWWSFFATADIDFIHTSGGQARGDSSSIKPGELDWNFVSSVTGKKIIADCGYGVAGGASNNCGAWTVSSNQNGRVQDGVIALSVAYPNGRVPKVGVTC